jgi:hypothetical protein
MPLFQTLKRTQSRLKHIFYRTKPTGQFWVKAAIMYLPMNSLAEQSFSPLRKTSGSEALLDVFFFFRDDDIFESLKILQLT